MPGVGRRYIGNGLQFTAGAMADQIVELAGGVSCTEVDFTNRITKAIANVRRARRRDTRTCSHVNPDISSHNRLPGEAYGIIASGAVVDNSAWKGLPHGFWRRVQLKLGNRRVQDVVFGCVRNPPHQPDRIDVLSRSQIDHYPLRVIPTREVGVEVRITFPKRGGIAIVEAGV